MLGPNFKALGDPSLSLESCKCNGGEVWGPRTARALARQLCGPCVLSQEVK